MIKLFNQWEISNIQVLDPGLKNYINLRPIIVPRTCGKNTKVRFHKSKYNIVERFINKLMIPGHKGKKHFKSSGHNTGKGVNAYKIVLDTFKMIESKTKKNPVEVFVKAIENASPREEITTIEYGGARYPQSVECSPQRRVDLVLRWIVQGSYQKSFGKKGKIENHLTEEILGAYRNDQKSAPILKKLEFERQADASR